MFIFVVIVGKYGFFYERWIIFKVRNFILYLFFMFYGRLVVEGIDKDIVIMSMINDFFFF